MGKKPKAKKPAQPKIQHTRAELEGLRDELLEELEHAAGRFDIGRDAAAKHLAVIIRVLVHDTPKSHSLLGQLGLKGDPFVDSAAPRDPQDVSGLYHGLASMAVALPTVRLRRDCVAMLDRTDGGTGRRISFDTWWNAVVFASKEMGEMTRKDLVLAVANEHGGAHVDPDGLSEPYAKLAKLNALGWTYRADRKLSRPLGGPHLVAVRQIAHEVLKTLRRGYAKTGVIEAGTAMVLGSTSLFPVAAPPPAETKTPVSAKPSVTVPATVHPVKGRGYIVFIGGRRMQISNAAIDAELARRQAVGGGIAAGDPTNVRAGIAVYLARTTLTKPNQHG